MSYSKKLDSREAWLKRLQIYWKAYSFPMFTARPGEIFEVDFGMNVGTEFSGRHLAICLETSLPCQEKMLVVPLTTKFKDYNISKEDLIDIPSTSGIQIKAGIVLNEAHWISKHRIFRRSRILEEPEGIVDPVKGIIKISKQDIERWRKI